MSGSGMDGAAILVALNALAAETSVLSRIATLSTLVRDDGFRRVATRAVDPSCAWGVPTHRIDSLPESCGGASLSADATTVWATFDRLADGALRGDAADRALCDVAHALDPPSGEVFRRILRKNLGCQVGVRTLERAAPGLLTTTPILEADRAEDPWFEAIDAPLTIEPELFGRRMTLRLDLDQSTVAIAPDRVWRTPHAALAKAARATTSNAGDAVTAFVRALKAAPATADGDAPRLEAEGCWLVRGVLAPDRPPWRAPTVERADGEPPSAAFWAFDLVPSHDAAEGWWPAPDHARRAALRALIGDAPGPLRLIPRIPAPRDRAERRRAVEGLFARAVVNGARGLVVKRALGPLDPAAHGLWSTIRPIERVDAMVLDLYGAPAAAPTFAFLKAEGRPAFAASIAPEAAARPDRIELGATVRASIAAYDGDAPTLARIEPE